MFNQNLWLLDSILRRKAILRCYRFALKRINLLQDDYLKAQLKQMLGSQLHENMHIKQQISCEFQTLQALNYVLVEALTHNNTVYMAKLIRVAYAQTFFQQDHQHAPFLVSKLEKFPQYVALSERDKKYYKYLVQQSVKRQNLPEWQKYKQMHEYLLDKKSEKLDQRVPLDVSPEHLEQIRSILRQQKPYWNIYLSVFAEVVGGEFKREAKPKHTKPDVEFPTPTYKWKPFNQMYKLRKNEWICI